MPIRPDRRRQDAAAAAHPEARGELHPPREAVTAAVTVAGPYAAVEKALRIGPDHLIALAYLRASTTEDGRFDAVLTTRGWRRWLRLPARIEFSRTDSRSEHALVHLTWQSRFSPQLLPVMEADLGLRPVSEHSTELVFTGEYRPPGGLAGLLADRLVGGRVALSTAEAFLEDLASAIERDLGRPQDTSPPSQPDDGPR